MNTRSTMPRGPRIKPEGRTTVPRTISINTRLDKRVVERMQKTPGLTYSKIVEDALMAFLGLAREQVT